MFVLLFSSANGEAQTKPALKAGLSGTSQPLAKALKAVSKVFDAKFVYERSLIDGKTTSYPVGDLKGKKLEDVLKSILYPEGLVFLYVKHNYYTIVSSDRLNDGATTPGDSSPYRSVASANTSNSAFTTSAKQKQAAIITVKGIVTNNSGKALQGVSVVVEGTDKGTMTDASGEYTLADVDEHASLVFSYIGYSVQTVAVQGRQTINITMEESSTGLNEVVVVGYGTQKKKDITGAVSVITAKELEERPNTQFGYSIEGKTAGVQVLRSSGQPQAGFAIRIRGTSTITAGSEPLYIVDGVPTTSTNEINPADIESLTILKDAS
jgi:hypothetical protein